MTNTKIIFKSGIVEKRVFRTKDGDLFTVNSTWDNGVVHMIYGTLRSRKTGTVKYGTNLSFEDFLDMVDHEIDLSPFAEILKDKDDDLKMDLDDPTLW